MVESIDMERPKIQLHHQARKLEITFGDASYEFAAYSVISIRSGISSMFPTGFAISIVFSTVDGGERAVYIPAFSYTHHSIAKRMQDFVDAVGTTNLYPLGS